MIDSIKSIIKHVEFWKDKIFLIDFSTRFYAFTNLLNKNSEVIWLHYNFTKNISLKIKIYFHISVLVLRDIYRKISLNRKANWWLIDF